LDKIQGVVEQCSLDATDLNHIFQVVSEHMNGKWHERYKRYVANMKEGRKCEVEKIWKRILDGIHLLAADFGIQKLDEIKMAIEDIKKLPSSLEDTSSGAMTFISHGSTGVSGWNYGKVNMGNEYGGDHNEHHSKSS
jgi:hypothetical protein